MKRLRRALLMLSIAVVLVCITVGATIAYLTATVSVTNTFKLGSVGITLDETGVDEYGNPPSSPMPTTSNDYKLVPGHAYTKDPTVHVTKGSEPCYLFVKVENGIADIEDHSNDIADQMITNGWAATTVANVYVYNGIPAVNYIVDASGSAADLDIKVFETFKISDDADIATYGDKQVKITAYAVQAGGFTSYDEAWTAAKFT